jgi:hypothetical protein
MWGRLVRICVYAISKNEELFVERCIRSAADADLFVLCDTGSTDRTVELARDAGATVYDITVRPWRFDHARNIAMGLIPSDVDVCISLDVDEVLEPGWRQHIEQHWRPNTTSMRVLFDWGGGVFGQTRIHSRHGWMWRHPCHEALYLDSRVAGSPTDLNVLLLRHLPDPTKSRAQYLDLLRAGATEDPFCSRNSFYYARELTYHRLWAEAATELERYLALPTAVWPAERALVARLLGDACEALNRGDAALEWYKRGTSEDPLRREPWVALADAMYRRAQWSECLAAAMKALQIVDFRTTWPNDATAWGWKPHDLAAIAAYRLGHADLAVTQGRLALEYAPADQRLNTNMKFYEELARGKPE